MRQRNAVGGAFGQMSDDEEIDHVTSRTGTERQYERSRRRAENQSLWIEQARIAERDTAVTKLREGTPSHSVAVAMFRAFPTVPVDHRQGQDRTEQAYLAALARLGRRACDVEENTAIQHGRRVATRALARARHTALREQAEREARREDDRLAAAVWMYNQGLIDEY